MPPPLRSPAQFKTADDLWNYTQEQVASVKESELTGKTAELKVALPVARAGVVSFLSRYPDDKQIWTVRDWKCDLDLISNHLNQPDAPRLEEIAEAYDQLGRDTSATNQARGIVKANALLIRIDQSRNKNPESEAFRTLSAQVAEYEKQFGPDLKFNNRNYALEVRTRLQYKTKPVEMRMTAVDGKPIDLSNLRGKVVLIDFWATWCGGCVLQLPQISHTYHQYHQQGLEIIGVSLDEDRKALVDFTKTHDMPWPQAFAAQERKEDFRETFGIEAMPTLWLIDRKGMLVTTNAEKDLSATIERLLGTP